MAVIVTTQVARKEYRCDGDHPDYTACTDPIRPGQTYRRVVVPPWEQYEADVDDEGRTVGVPCPEAGWTILRGHVGCWIG